MAGAKQRALIFILLTVLMDVVGFSIIIPVIPDLLKKLTHFSTGEVASIGGWLLMSTAAMQFLFAPVMGELSDRIGRRPVLLMALAGLGIDYIIHAYAPSVAWLFFGRILAGIFGSSHTVAMAYVADVSTQEEKARNFGMIGAVFGLGFIIGPLIGGIFAKWGVEVPFLVAAGLTLLNLLFGFFILPESLKPELRRPVNFKKMIPGVSLFRLGSYKAFAALLFAFFLAMVAGQTLPSVWTYFTIEMYNWGAFEVALSLAAVGLLVAVVQGFLLGKIVSRFGSRRTILIGFVCWTVGMGMYAFSFEEYILYAALIPYCLGGVGSPTLQSLISNHVSQREQGNLQGTMTSMASLAMIITPPLMTQVFSTFTTSTEHYFPGAPFALAAVILLVGTFIALNGLSKLDT
ncbi:MAG: TCR/Tet family MFS transporter [Flavobacteriales bacterium]|nr:TCR/Tet family MFS transporter [Flavobacteriales bacterium]